MPEDANATEGTEGQPDAQAGQDPNAGSQQSADAAQQQGEGKTFTEAELNAIINDRLAKQEKSLTKRLESEKKQAAERAKMDEAERIKAEKADLEKQLEQVQTEKREAVQRSQLSGKVTDVDYALFKAQQDPDKYVDSDGNVKVDALLKDVESLNPQPEPRSGPAPTTAGGGSAKGADMNSFIRRKAGRG